MISEVLKQIKNRVKVLILLRGLPGSGKSTLAKRLNISGRVLSTDDYFYVGRKYHYDWAKLTEAHEWNKERAARALEYGVTPVIIDNTNVQSWEMKPYVALGVQFQYNIHILEPKTPWKFKPGELSRRNQHKVSKEKICRMLERYDHNVTVQSIVNSLHDTSEISNAHTSEFSNSFPCEVSNSRPSEASNSEPKCAFQKCSESQFHSSVGVSRTERNSSDRSSSKNFSSVHNNNNSSVNEMQLPKSSVTSETTEHPQSSISDKLKKCSNNFSSLLEKKEIEKVSISSESEKYSDNCLKIASLKDLKVLSQEGSEENRSSSYQTSPLYSSQDGSDWESLSDQDEFQWATHLPPSTNESIKSEIVISKDAFINNDSNDFTSKERVSQAVNVKKGFQPNVEVTEMKEINSNGLCNSENLEEESKSSYSDWNTGESFSSPKPQRRKPDPEWARNFFSTNKSGKSESMPPKDAFIHNDSKNFPSTERVSQAVNVEKGFHAIHEVTKTKDMNSIGSCSTNDLEEELQSCSDYNKEEFSSPPKPQCINSELFILNAAIEVSDFDTKNSAPSENCNNDVMLIVDKDEKSVALWDSLIATDWSDEFQPSKSENQVNPKPQRKLNVSNDESLTLSNSVSKELKTHTLETIDEEKSVKGCEISNVYNKKSPKFRYNRKNRYPNVASYLGDLPNKINATNWEFPAFDIEDPINSTNRNSGADSPGWECSYGKSDAESEAPYLKTCDSDIVIDKEIVSSLVTSESLNTSEKLEILQDCFPDISHEDLQHYLQLCNHDSNWLSSIFLDWGYSYNKHDETLELHDLEVGESSVSADYASSSKNSIEHNAIEKKLTTPLESTVGSSVPMEDIRETYQNIQLSSVSGGNCLWKNFEEFEIDSTSVPHGNLQAESGNDSNSSSGCRLALNFSLTLDAAFASNLQEHFGTTVVDDIHSLKNRTVVIGEDLAKQIYYKWMETINCNSSSYVPEKTTGHENVLESKANFEVNQDANFEVSQDANFEVNQILKLNQDAQAKNVVVSDFSCSTNSQTTTPISLAEVMNLEYALELQQKEKLKLAKQKIGGELAAKIKRQKLYDMFPKVDRKALDDVLETNEFSLSNSIFAVEALVGQSSKQKETEYIEDNFVNGNKENILRDFVMEDWSEWVYTPASYTEDYESSFSTPNIGDLRQKAVEQYHLWQECAQKTKNFYQRGMKEVASFYSIQGSTFERNFRQANKRAMEAINVRNRSKNPGPHILDLHGLYVQEAIPVLEHFLKAQKSKYCKMSGEPLTLSVITGHGTRSNHGAKLRPAVAAYFNSKGYRYDEINPGMFGVTLFS